LIVSGKGIADVGGDADEGKDDLDNDLFEEKRYEKTKAKKWTMYTDR
jgi:hypothetical protein